MSLMLFLAAATVPSMPSRVQARGEARIRVLQAVRVTEETWADARRRTDRLVRDDLGRDIRLRTIDFE